MNFSIKEILPNGFLKENKINPRKYARKTKKFIDGILKGMGNEANETIEMADSFFRLLNSKLNLSERDTPPSKEEVKAAIAQLKDIGRLSVFVTAVVLPGGVVSLFGLELLARKYGIKNFHLIPSSFQKNKQVPKDDIGQNS